MTLRVDAAGNYSGDFRFDGFDRLHLSMRTRKKKEADARHDAVRYVFRLRPPRTDLVDALRAGRLSVETLELMVREGRAIELPRDTATADAVRSWGTLDEVIVRYLEWLGANQNRADNTYATRRSQ